MRGVKYAQGGMKVKKANGDPPKGYKRDADGYLSPLDWSEFHDEAASDTTNYVTDAYERIQRQMPAESGGEGVPAKAV